MPATKVGSLLILAAACLHAQHEFSYEGATGPSHWGDLNAEYSTCKTGTQQSPIDIRNTVTADLPPIVFDYKSSSLRLINNGHTLQVNYTAGSSITVGGERYDLRQFHFHHPSEERIDGKASDMVAHLVHANAKGELAVVAVLLKTGKANDVVGKVWSALPKATAEDKEIAGVNIDAAGLLPRAHSYFTYQGSLTTPPCTEGVRWLILTTPVEVSADQIHTFGTLFHDNARPSQPLGNRTVQRSR